jgi:hypothetical protein
MDPPKSPDDKSYTEEDTPEDTSSHTKTEAKNTETTPKVSLRELFQYADKYDIFLIISGVFVSIGNGTPRH